MTFVATERVNPTGSTGREGFDPSQHPRSSSGRFTEKTGSLPEVELGYRWKEIWEFDDGWTMAVEQANSYYPEFKRGWLRLPDGTPIGMIHWSTKDAEPCICDIEVRDEYRGQGLAKRLIHSVEDQIGGRLHTTGSFTPEGRAALAAATPQASGYPARQHDFRSMTFIHDWDALQTNS